MMAFLRKHWAKISTGLLLASLVGAVGFKIYEAHAASCCAPGSPCCYPGSPCCAGHSKGG
jgi:hypothetical protein